MTTEDKINCLKRELTLRARVYPRRVSEGRMSQRKADYEISVLAAILADYEALLAKERLI